MPEDQLGIRPGEGPKKVIALRTGQWTDAEITFANEIISRFHFGTLPRCENGTTLRALLSDLLHCSPMRISKKFSGDGAIGKRAFKKAAKPPSHAEMVALASLEQRFHESIDGTDRWPHAEWETLLLGRGVVEEGKGPSSASSTSNSCADDAEYQDDFGDDYFGDDDRRHVPEPRKKRAKSEPAQYHEAPTWCRREGPGGGGEHESPPWCSWSTRASTTADDDGQLSHQGRHSPRATMTDEDMRVKCERMSALAGTRRHVPAGAAARKGALHALPRHLALPPPPMHALHPRAGFNIPQQPDRQQAPNDRRGLVGGTGVQYSEIYANSLLHQEQYGWVPPELGVDKSPATLHRILVPHSLHPDASPKLFYSTGSSPYTGSRTANKVSPPPGASPLLTASASYALCLKPSDAKKADDEKNMPLPPDHVVRGPASPPLPPNIVQSQ